MVTQHSIDQLNELLQNSNLTWLLPNLRQDYVVWNSLINPEFYSKFIKLRGVDSTYLPSDFTPSRLALIALDQTEALSSEPKDVYEAINSQVLPMAMRILNDKALLLANPQDLATAGLIAIALTYKYRTSNSWSGLLDTIQDTPGKHWFSPLTCLYSLVDGSAGLLNSLVQPGASSIRIELAVHAVLSNPILPNDQIAILMSLCHGAYNDLLPARERVLLLHTLSEQRPQAAIDFCSKWLEIHPIQARQSHHISTDSIEEINNLAENFFLVEVTRILGNDQSLAEFLRNEKDITQNVSIGISNHYASQIIRQQPEKFSINELSSIWDQFSRPADLTNGSGNITREKSKRGLILAEQGLLEEAEKMIAPSVSPLPDEPDVLYSIAVLTEKTGDHARAFEAATKLVDILEQNGSISSIPVWGEFLSQVNLGTLLITLNKPEAAAKILRNAVQTCPNDTSLLKIMAESYRRSHEYHLEAEIMRSLLAISPGNMDYHRMLADALENTGDWEASLDQRAFIVDTAKAQSKNLPINDIYAYIKSSYHAHRPELTITLCDDLLATYPEDCQGLIYSGLSYIDQNLQEKGMEILTRATHFSPDSEDAWLALATAQKKLHPPQNVIDTLNNAIQAVPDSSKIHFMLGQLYLDNNALTLALPELRAAVELAPEDPQILVSYGQALDSLGHREESRLALAKAYQLNPTWPGLAQKYAKILISMDFLEEAIPPLEMLISAKNLQDSTPYMEYAHCILTLNKMGLNKYPPMKALIALNEALQIDPEHAEAKALIAESLYANGDMEMAFHAYREAMDTTLIEDKSWLERLSYGFGCVASSLGKHDIAIAVLQEAGQVNPDNTAVFKALSDAYLESSLPEDALRAARNVLVINGDDPDNLSWFASQSVKLINRAKSNYSNSPASYSKTIPNEALNALAKAIQLAPTRTDLLVQLGNLQATIGAREDSRRTLASIALLDFAAIPDLKKAAEYLSGIGDHEAAIACLENGISQDSKSEEKHDPTLYTLLAREYVSNNDHTSAINTLDKAMDILPEENSLISNKIDILLDLGQPLEALNCIEQALHTTSGNQNFDLLFLASTINHAIGDFSAAIRYARNGVRALTTNQNASTSRIPARYRTHIAEIYRALMQPEQAFQIINNDGAVHASDFPDEQGFLEFLCLHTELALETGNQIRSDFQEIQSETSSLFFSRLMAINARLLNKAGNNKQAEKLFQVSNKSLKNIDQQCLLPNWSISYLKYLTLNSVIEAALDLGLWDQAVQSTQSILESAPNEPISSLNLAKAIVLKAEYFNLCRMMDVSTHRPNANSISDDTFSQFTRYLENSRSTLELNKSEPILSEYELTNDQYYRWLARAQIAFNTYDNKINDPGEVLTHQHTPGDCVALITHLHHTGLQDPEGESTSRIIKIARSNPKNPIVLLQVALSIQDNNPLDAMKSLQTVLEQNPYSKTPASAFCYYQLAKIAFALEEHDIAQEAIENALMIWPDEPAWHALAAQIHNQAMNTHAAINHLIDATNLAPNNFSYYMELANIYYDNANEDPHLLNQALTAYENARALDPNDITNLIQLANTHYQLNDLESADSCAHQALQNSPERADIYQLLSEISIGRKDYQGAYEYANKAIQLNPKDLKSNIMLARSLSSLGRYEEALAKINTMLPMVQDAKLLQLERVNILRRMNGARAGLSELKNLLNTYPDDFHILNALARTYHETGEAENAVNFAQQAIKVCPEKTSRNDQANLHLLIGKVLRQSGQLDQSINHLNKAIELAPDRLEPYLELGLARKERREYDQAIHIFEQATSIAPEDPRALFQAGLALKESKDYKSSETMLRRAVSLAPNDLNIRRQLAAVVALNLVHNPRSGRS